MERLSENLYCGLYDSNSVFPRKNRSPLRRVDQYELELFTEERGTRIVNGTAYPIGRRMLLCCKPGMECYSLLPFRCYFIHLQASSGPATEVLSRLPVCTQLSEGEYLRLLPWFLELAQCFAEEEPLWQEIRLQSLFYGLLADCRSILCPGEKPRRHPAVELAVQYMNDHGDRPCSLTELAEQAKLSPNHFRTLFCREMGISPREYLEKRRLEQAKKLLLTGDRPLAELALELGFSSQSHFGQVFRAAEGVTPTQYRRRRSWKYDR